MSFSWMKPSTSFLPRALSTTLAFSATFSAVIGFSPNANAEPIYDDSRSDRAMKVSYAQQMSEVKEDILTKEEVIEAKQAELDRANEDLAKLRNWDDWKGDDIYGGPCLCSEKTSCNVETLLSLGIIADSDTKWTHVMTNGCIVSGKPSSSVNASGSASTARTKTVENDEDDKRYPGTGGGNGIGKNSQNCISKLAIGNSADHAAICRGIDNHARSHGRASTGLSAACIESARNCGAVKYLRDKENLPRTIEELKKEISLLEKEKKKLMARRKSIERECPSCSDLVVEGADRPGLGDYIVGGLHAVSPMVVAGIQAGSYNKYLKTSLNAYNGYLNNSLQNCQSYYSQGTTVGIPSTPCHSGMWTGGVAQAPGGGGYGIYGAIGMSGGVGMMYGMPGGYAAGYGAYGYGGGGIGGVGAAIGSVVGGAFGGPYGGYGQIGGPAMGMMYGGSYGGYGQIGGGIAGGIAPMYGGSYGGGYGQIGGAYGGYGGSYVSTMGYAGSYGYGVDPSAQLNAQRMQMQQQNMQISQQQLMEAQYRNQQVSSGIGGYGFGSYGAPGIGGYGYGAQIGGYGYGGYGGGYGAQVIGTAIGSFYGAAY